MLNADEVFRLLRAGNPGAVHDLIDAAFPTATVEERHSMAHWRTAALLKEKRYQEALDHLEHSKIDYFCKTLAHHQKAEIYDRLGRGREALMELSQAPFEAEFDWHIALVTDARFFLLYLLAKENLPIKPDDLDLIPDDFASVFRGVGYFTKDDLKALIGTAP